MDAVRNKISMSRREDLRLVTGNGCYSADWNLPGQLYAAFVRADRAHAKILRLDASRALVPYAKSSGNNLDASLNVFRDFRTVKNVAELVNLQR